MQFTLLALFLMSFGIGITEYVPIGLLPDIASDLHVSLSQAGLIISAYSMGVTIGSPFMALLTARLNKHKAMLILGSVFVLGNLYSALASNYTSLIISRLVTSLCHGAFFGLGAVIAISIAPAKQKAQAIAIMFAGLTISNIIGVPLDTAIGQYLGWRTAFLFVTVIGLIASICLYLWIPRNLISEKISLLKECRAVLHKEVLLTMLVSVLSAASVFSVLSYITPLLENVTQVSPLSVTLYLMLYGLGITIGNFIGGKLADWKLTQSLIGIFFMVSIIMMVFMKTIYSHYAAALTVFLWGTITFSAVPPLQMRAVHEAKDAPNVASTVNQSAFHLGISLGTFLSSLVLAAGHPIQQTFSIGLAISILALLITLLFDRLK